MAAVASFGPDARDIARMVPIRQVLRHLGWTIRPRGRADCGLCRGSSKGTVAYREDVWHCHRCHEGGDVYSLVRAVQGCDFRVALRVVADLAGVRLDTGRDRDEWRRAMEAGRRKSERIKRVADRLAGLERALRLECRDRIHAAERKLAALLKATAWSERDWLIASALHDSLQHDLVEYTLLGFGAVAERAQYVLHPEQREQMAGSVRSAGGILTDDGCRMEVIA